MTPTNPAQTVGADSLDALGALAEPNRRVLYDFVVSQRDWVSRDQATDATGLRRGIVAHHLDRLADDGLLDVEHRRLTGRKGPGAGRPAKLYRRSDHDVGVSLPPRRYDLAGSVLSKAAERALRDGTPLDAAIAQAATDRGREIGQSGLRRLADANGDTPGEAGSSAGSGRPDAGQPEVPAEPVSVRGATTSAPDDGLPGPADTAQRHGCAVTPGRPRCMALFAELRDWGFEPETRHDGVTVLHNCPFHQLSAEHTALICGLNLSLLEGVVEGIGEPGLEPRLEPAEDHCCVRFHPVPAAQGSAADET